MRVQRVVTNESCNQNCPFCAARRPSERAAFLRSAAARVASAARQRPDELVLAGGEPALRRDLASLVRLAKSGGARRVVLETNAATLDSRTASDLRSAGLDTARVKVPAWGPLYDRITRDEGGFDRFRAGLAALAAAGIAVEALVPVVRANLESVGDLPSALAAHAGTIVTIVAGVPQQPVPDEDAIAPLPRASVALERLAAEAMRLGFAVRLDPDGFVPPCSFPSPGRLSGLFALSPGGRTRPGFVQLAGCAGCVLRDLCPGVPAEAVRRGDVVQVRAITRDETRRRLTLISSQEEQVARELVTREEHRGPDGRRRPVRTVRVNFRCNQACAFCFVSTHLPAARDADVRSAIAEAGRAGAALALSGGEPTLNPALAEYVRLAKRSGVSEVELQTNAVRLDDAALVAELEAAGVDVAFVSLHGSRAEVSDAVTGSPGTFERTVLGIDRLAASAIKVRLNFVHCTRNTADFSEFVRLVAARWPGADLAVSVVAPSTDLVPLTPDLVPRYSDVKPHLAEGLRIARELGLRVTGFESMCAVPLCLLPEEARDDLLPPELGAGDDGAGEFTKVDRCAGCRANGRCFGIRRRYAELYGTGELSPL